jgi:heme oxygenase (biliverdin-IX-beta and delta-forming)
MDDASLQQLAQLIGAQRVASLGTLREGSPFVSMVLYAPAPDFRAYYIHTSRLAYHTQDILRDPRVSLMIAETDEGTRDPQTLARVSIQGEAHMVPPDDLTYATARDVYLSRFPQSEMTFGFADFALYCITIERARYVAGFARAFNLKPAHFEQAAQLA